MYAQVVNARSEAIAIASLPFRDQLTFAQTRVRVLQQQRQAVRPYQQLRYWSNVPFRHGPDDVVKYSLTLEHFRWAFMNFVPEAIVHSKLQDQRIVREHYDRGDDFFEWFLGERMVYTCAFFQNPDESVEAAP